MYIHFIFHYEIDYVDQRVRKLLLNLIDCCWLELSFIFNINLLIHKDIRKGDTCIFKIGNVIPL